MHYTLFNITYHGLSKTSPVSHVELNAWRMRLFPTWYTHMSWLFLYHSVTCIIRVIHRHVSYYSDNYIFCLGANFICIQIRVHISTAMCHHRCVVKDSEVTQVIHVFNDWLYECGGWLGGFWLHQSGFGAVWGGRVSITGLGPYAFLSDISFWNKKMGHVVFHPFNKPT